MPKFKPDTCTCYLEYNIDETDSIVGKTVLSSCGIHATFDEALEYNRLKNSSINSITEIIDMEGKEIGWSSSEGVITLTLYNFTETDLENVYALSLDVTIVEV